MVETSIISYDPDRKQWEKLQVYDGLDSYPTRTTHPYVSNYDAKVSSKDRKFDVGEQNFEKPVFEDHRGVDVHDPPALDRQISTKRSPYRGVENQYDKDTRKKSRVGSRPSNSGDPCAKYVGTPGYNKCRAQHGFITGDDIKPGPSGSVSGLIVIGIIAIVVVMMLG